MRPAIACTTFGDLVVRAAERAPDEVGVAFLHERFTNAELLGRALTAARGLRALGVQRGDRVGILMPNCPFFVDALFGASLLGAIVVTVNARYRAHELEYVARDAGLKVLVTIGGSERADYRALAADALRELDTRLVVDRFETFEEVGEPGADVRLRDSALMMYTSGTTARPKGCLLSHEALVRTGIAQAHRYEITPEDVYWCPLPLFHMGGILPLTASLWAGARFVTAVAFEPGEALRQMESERATLLFVTFPAISGPLIHHPDFAATDLSAGRLINHSAQPDVQRAVQRAFPHAKHVQSYGCTELGGVTAVSRLDDPDETCATTCGHPWEGMELTLSADGEILGRGFGMFDGYWNDPVRTAEVIDADGWFHTGDLGAFDADGRIMYLGRSKDMLKVGGENVAALEVESYLCTHPDVRFAQVVGVPDERLGEVVAAFLELEPGASVGLDDVVEFCRGRIASYKIPRQVRVVDEWPMSATKIQKFKLREQLVAQLSAVRSA